MSTRASVQRKKSNGRSARDTGRAFLFAAAAIGVLAIILRVLFLLQLKDTPFFSGHFSDTRLYMQLARDIAFGDGIQRAFFMSPLYPHLVAAVWKLTGNPEMWMRILQILFGAASALLTLLIARRLFDTGTGVLAGVLTALYAPLVFYDGLLLTESLQTLLLTAHMLLILLALKRSQAGWWVTAGLLLGLAAVTRANVLLFLPVFLIAWMFTSWLRASVRVSHLAYYAAAVLLTLAPTTVHNAAEEGVFIPVTSSLGYNLYAGNNPEADGFYTMPEPVDLYTDPNGEAWVEQQTGRDMNAAEVSAWWRDRALTWMGEHPGEAVTLFGQKLLLFFHPEEIDQLGLSMEFFADRYGTVIGLPSDLFPVLLLLAFAGFALLLRDSRHGRILLLFLLVFAAANALFFVSGRLRLPVLPLMIIAASHAGIQLFNLLRQREAQKRSVISLAMGAAVAAAVLILQPAVQQSFAQEYLKLGQMAFDSGEFSQAESHFRTSVEEKRTVDGLTNLGNALAAQQQSANAAEAYREAIAVDSTSALAWFNYGNLLMQTGRPQYAYGTWKRALELQPRLAAAHRNLGLLLFRAGRLQEALRHLETYTGLERDGAKKREIERDIARIRSMLQQQPR